MAKALSQDEVTLDSNVVTAPVVPEPGTLTLLAFGSLAVLRRQ